MEFDEEKYFEYIMDRVGNQKMSLSPEWIFQKKTVGFHLPTEPYGCFSNWYPSRFTYAGRTYNCVEQYMMAQKVEHR